MENELKNTNIEHDIELSLGPYKVQTRGKFGFWFLVIGSILIFITVVILLICWYLSGAKPIVTHNVVPVQTTTSNTF